MTDRRAVLVFFVVGLFLGGCGGGETEVKTDPTGISAAPAVAAAGVQDGSVNADEQEPGTVGLELEAEQYALEFGVTEEEALRRFGRADELKAILQEIVAAETGRVAGWGLMHEPEFGGWVYLVGDAEPTRTTGDLQAQHSDLFVELGATHTLAELEAAMSNRSNFEAFPVSMRDRVAYTEIDVRSNSLVIAIDRDKPPTPIDESVPAAERSIESMDLLQAAEALEEILEQATGLPFSVRLDSRSSPD